MSAVAKKRVLSDSFVLQKKKRNLQQIAVLFVLLPAKNKYIFLARNGNLLNPKD